MAEVKLDKTDRLLIGVVDQAVKRGVGRTFASPTGRTVKVLAIDETWVRLGHGPGFVEELVLPRKNRDIARKAALLQGRIG